MLWRVCTFAQAYLSLRHCAKSHVLPKMAIYELFTPAANTPMSLHICTGIVTGQCDSYQDLMCRRRRLLGVCTFAQARLSLCHSTEISCAGSNGDLCTVYVNSKCCGESAPVPLRICSTISASYQCFKKCLQCVVIKFLNKTFASLPRSKQQSGDRFGCYFMGI